MKRGTIYNRKWSQQIRDFSGMSCGQITPTDVDAMIDYMGMLFIFFEFKYCKGEYVHKPSGQFRALETVCDVIKKGGAVGTFCVCTHELEPECDIPVHEMEVVAYYIDGAYRKPNRKITAREFMRWMIKRLHVGDLKPEQWKCEKYESPIFIEEEIEL